jgi:molybdopterin molybdotransferase
MRPGSPVSFGRLPERSRGTPVFGLPGNPGSAFVTFEVFVRPFLLALGGHRRILRRTLRCRSADRLRLPARLTHFPRVTVTVEDGEPVAGLTGSQGSGLVGGLARTEGLAVVAEDIDLVEAGADIDVMLLDDAPAAEEVAEG